MDWNHHHGEAELPSEREGTRDRTLESAPPATTKRAISLRPLFRPPPSFAFPSTTTLLSPSPIPSPTIPGFYKPRSSPTMTMASMYPPPQQPPPSNAYAAPPPSMAPTQQQPSTIPPGTPISLTNHTVTVERYLSQGTCLLVYPPPCTHHPHQADSHTSTSSDHNSP